MNFDRTNPQLLAQYAQVLPGYTTADIIGSPYAVYQYTCNPELGSDQDILNLKTRVNSLGMKLMLDFVPNHSAVDCPLVTSNPDLYIHAPKGTQPPYNSNMLILFYFILFYFIFFYFIFYFCYIFFIYFFFFFNFLIFNF